MSLMDALSQPQPSAPPPPSAASASASSTPAPNGSAGTPPGTVEKPAATTVAPDALTTPAPGKTEMGANGGPDTSDWRAMMAGEDADAIKDLSRYDSPAALLKAFKEQRTALSKRAEPVKLGDNPTPEQIAAYRKAQGVPEIPADAPPEKIAEAYGIKPPEGYEMSETEKGMIGEFAKRMHGKHMSPGAVKEATDFFFQQQAAAAQAVRRDSADKAKAWKNALIDKHGTKEYEGQQAAAKAFMLKEFDNDIDAMANILTAQLPGGGMLGDNPWFFELVAKNAMGAGFTDRIEANALEANGKTLLEQRAEIESLILTDRPRYDALQPKLQQINRGLRARGQIDANGDPVRRRA